MARKNEYAKEIALLSYKIRIDGVAVFPKKGRILEFVRDWVSKRDDRFFVIANDFFIYIIDKHFKPKEHEKDRKD